MAEANEAPEAPSAPVPDAKPQKKRSPPLGWGGFILGVLDVIYMKYFFGFHTKIFKLGPLCTVALSRGHVYSGVSRCSQSGVRVRVQESLKRFVFAS